MKVATTLGVIERSGTFKESAFTFKADQRSFKLLSDDVYSNKIAAVIRELGNNAQDAHIDAKNTDPFEVHLPTYIEPYFNIRDYGKGLSNEDIQGLYTQYFFSTKTDNNEATGYLGIGSKAPFATTDSYTVTSYFQGVKTSFNMYLNEERIPVCAMLGGEETDELNGIEVNIPVEDDHSSWHKEARLIYSFFKLKPKFIGKQIEFIKFAPILEEDDWQLFSSHQLSATSAVAIMGSVAYPISNAVNQIPSAKNLINAPLFLYFELGELETALSREALSLSPHTVKSLTDKLDKVNKKLLSKAQEKINKCPDLWTARFEYQTLLNAGIFAYTYGRNTLTFNGKSVESTNITVNGATIQKVSMKGQVCSRRTSGSYIYTTANDKYFWKDNNQCFNRLSHLVRSGGATNSKYSYGPAHYLIEPFVDTVHPNNPPITKAKFEEILGKTVLDISSLPKPPRVKQNRTKQPIRALTITDQKVVELEDTISEEEHYIYTNRNNYAARGNNHENGLMSLNGFAELIFEFNKEFPKNKIDNRLLLFKKHLDERKVSKFKLINAYDHMCETVKKSISDEMLDYLIFDGYGYNNVTLGMIELVAKHGTTYADECKKVIGAAKTVSLLKALQVGFKTSKPSLIDTDAFIGKYPMLQLAFDSGSKYLRQFQASKQQLLIQYVS